MHKNLSETNRISIQYLGQEGFILQYGSTSIMIDGYLSDYVDRNCCRDGVVWKRRYAPPVSPASLVQLDYVFCTHSHFDHADPDTLSAIALANRKAKFIVPATMRKEALSYGIEEARLICAYADVPLRLDTFSVMPLPSAHEELLQDENGNFTALGYRFSFGAITVYHAGDCCLYEGLESRLQNTDILMLPVNGRSWYKKEIENIIGNMTSEESVLLAKHISPSLLIPMHYDLYDVNCINPATFVDTLYRLSPAQSFHMFTPGERYIFEKD